MIDPNKIRSQFRERLAKWTESEKKAWEAEFEREYAYAQILDTLDRLVDKSSELNNELNKPGIERAGDSVFDFFKSKSRSRFTIQCNTKDVAVIVESKLNPAA